MNMSKPTPIGTLGHHLILSFYRIWPRKLGHLDDNTNLTQAHAGTLASVPHIRNTQGLSHTRLCQDHKDLLVL